MGGTSSQSGLLSCLRVARSHSHASQLETLRLAVMTLAREYLATGMRPLETFCKIFTAAKTFLDVVTCKNKTFAKMF